MNNKRVLRPGTWLVAASLVLGVSMAQAVPTSFTGLDNTNLSAGGLHPNADAARSDFLVAAGPVAVQGFEGMPAGPVPSSFSVGARTVSYTGMATDYEKVTVGAGGFDTFATAGTHFLEALTDSGATYFTMLFDQAVTAFGFDITDASDWIGTQVAATLVVDVLQVSGTTSLSLFPGTSASAIVTGNVGFFGVVDTADPILGFSIRNPIEVARALPAGSANEDALGLDQLTLAQAAAVPEPATLLLAGGALFAASRRQRARHA